MSWTFFKSFRRQTLASSRGVCSYTVTTVRANNAVLPIGRDGQSRATEVQRRREVADKSVGSHVPHIDILLKLG